MKQAIGTYNPTLSSVAFWDVAVDQLNFDTDSQFIINKVFNYGLWSDMLVVMNYYGLDRIRREVVKVAYLKKTALSFLCVVLDLHESDFDVYQQRQARPSVWES